MASAPVAKAGNAQTVAGHSLRSGFATEAAMAAWPTAAIMAQTGHKSHEMVMRYIRPVHRRSVASLL